MNLSKLLIRAYNTVLGDPDRFDAVLFETTTECNRGCEYCPVSQNRRPVAKLDVYPIIDELRKHHYIGSISWGFFNESLLDNDLYSKLSYCRFSLPLCRQHIFTNGDKLNCDNVRELLELASITIGRHNNSNILPLLNSLPERLIKRLRIALPMEATITSRGGLIKSRIPTPLVQSCDPSAAIVTGDGYLALCPNQYDYARLPQLHVPSVGLFQAWHNMRTIREQVRAWVNRPDCCVYCTENRVAIISGRDFIPRVSQWT